MPRSHLTSALPSWFPGFLSYLSLLVINAILSSIAILTLNNVATGLEIALVACNSSAAIVLLGMSFYKAIKRSCVFNNFKSDRKALSCVVLLDLCAAVGWSVRLDRKGSCAKAAPGSARSSSCNTSAALVAAGLILAWISVVIAYCAAVSSDRGAKKRRPSPLPIQVSRPAISSPVIIHAGQFSAYESDVDSKFISFTNIPLGGPNRGHFVEAV